jgi:hypothetical protein
VEGKTLLLRNLHLNPGINTLLTALLETGFLRLPVGLVRKHPNFRLFCTAQELPASSHLWHIRYFAEPDLSSVEQMISTRFPGPHCSQLARVYLEIKAFLAQERIQISLHDLFKFLGRIYSLQLDAEQQDFATMLFWHAFDCFIAGERNSVDLAHALGQIVGLDANRVDFYLNHYVPGISHDACTPTN